MADIEWEDVDVSDQAKQKRTQLLAMCRKDIRNAGCLVPVLDTFVKNTRLCSNDAIYDEFVKSSMSDGFLCIGNMWVYLGEGWQQQFAQACSLSKDLIEHFNNESSVSPRDVSNANMLRSTRRAEMPEVKKLHAVVQVTREMASSSYKTNAHCSAMLQQWTDDVYAEQSTKLRRVSEDPPDDSTRFSLVKSIVRTFFDPKHVFVFAMVVKSHEESGGGQIDAKSIMKELRKLKVAGLHNDKSIDESMGFLQRQMLLSGIGHKKELTLVKFLDACRIKIKAFLASSDSISADDRSFLDTFERMLNDSLTHDDMLLLLL